MLTRRGLDGSSRFYGLLSGYTVCMLNLLVIFSNDLIIAVNRVSNIRPVPVTKPDLFPGRNGTHGIEEIIYKVRI